MFSEVYEFYAHFRGKSLRRWSSTLVVYFSRHFSWSKTIDFLRETGMIIVFSAWGWLVFDTSRDVDLDVQSYVDLEYTANVFQLYNFAYNVIVLVSLFSMLQYTGLDDRIALVSRLIGAAIGDLVPFLFLFLSFVVVYCLSGHFLYGPVLKEWSTPFDAFVTAMDIVMGNYLYTQMEEGIDKENLGAVFIGFIFYYTFSWMMMLLLLNVVIAILMDGYATVKETTSSAVQANINKNVGPILPLILASNKFWWTVHWNRLRCQPPPENARLWSDSQWLCALKVVAKQRASSGRASVLRVSELCHDMRRLPLSDGEDVVWQILNKFQYRYYHAPTDITNPFSEPDMEAHVKELILMNKELKAQLTEQDHHSKDLADQLHEQGQHISLLLRLVDNMADVASNVQDLRDKLCKQHTSPEAHAVVVPGRPPATPTRVATREAAATKAAEGTAVAKTEAAEEEVNGVSSYRVRGGMCTPPPQLNHTRPATAGGDDKPAPPCPAPSTVGGGGA